MAKVLAIITIAAILSISWTASAAAPADGELDLLLHSVHRRSGDVFVSNDAGIFRAELEQKQWEKLKLPETMPLGGRFGTVAVGSPQILYSGRPSRQRQEGKVHGLYRSSDNGQTWQLLLEGDQIGEVLMLSSGDLFVTLSEHAFVSKSSIQMTSDFGKTWRDITDSSSGYISELFPDPDHPGLICVRTHTVRSYILQAEDERYRWKATRSWDWHPKLGKKEAFSQRNLAPADESPSHMISATLRNYFDHDFGGTVSVPAIDLRPDADKFSFQLGDEVEIPITIRFLTSESSEVPLIEEKLIDHPTDLGFWGLSAELGDKQIHQPPAIPAAFRKVRTDNLVARARGKPDHPAELEAEFIRSEKEIEGWQTFAVSAEKPYRRMLDLSRLYQFDELGRYRVQLHYCNEGIGDRGQGHWVGSFATPVFTIDILPGK